MKKAKHKALVNAARKAAKGSIKEKAIKALTEAALALAKPSKAVEKTIKKEAKKIAKKIAAMLDVDVEALLAKDAENVVKPAVTVAAKVAKPAKKTVASKSADTTA